MEASPAKRSEAVSFGAPLGFKGLGLQPSERATLASLESKKGIQKPTQPKNKAIQEPLVDPKANPTKTCVWLAFG